MYVALPGLRKACQSFLAEPEVLQAEAELRQYWKGYWRRDGNRTGSRAWVTNWASRVARRFSPTGTPQATPGQPRESQRDEMEGDAFTECPSHRYRSVENRSGEAPPCGVESWPGRLSPPLSRSGPAREYRWQQGPAPSADGLER